MRRFASRQPCQVQGTGTEMKTFFVILTYVLAAMAAILLSPAARAAAV